VTALTDASDVTDTAVAVRGLHRVFGDRTVIDGLDLSIRPGEFVALIGASGGGKSTLLRILANLDHGYTGTVQTPSRRTVVFQDARLLPWMSALENVVLGLSGRDLADRGRAALNEVSLSHRVDAWPLTLSGGEAQRVSIARALIREPELLLLDEPFQALDALTRLQMYTLVRRLCEQHRPAVLLVTHDVDEALLLADRVAVLRNGKLAVDLPVELPAQHRRRDPRFVIQSERLLAELGVTDTDQ
jgi:sulfonate transport system ATP-binding protein